MNIGFLKFRNQEERIEKQELFDNVENLDKVYATNGDSFEEFLANRGTELKSEFYLPGAVDTFMKAGECDVRVYRTDAQWYGVTYTQDKDYVKASIRKMIEQGIYPNSLWG